MIGFTTLPNPESASLISETFVKEGLAACVQTGQKISSIYIWEGKLQKEDEIPLVVKFLQSKEAALFKRLTELHPYECPEWLSIKAQSVASAYAKWMRT